jgi:hypothetical protein
MRFVSFLFALGLSGCTYPYPVLAASSGATIPVNVANKPLSEQGARVTVVAEPPSCSFLGLATGVGGLRDENAAKDDSGLPAYREEAVVALRNVVGARGGTHVVVDATMLDGRAEAWAKVLLRGRAFRC